MIKCLFQNVIRMTILDDFIEELNKNNFLNLTQLN